MAAQASLRLPERVTELLQRGRHSAQGNLRDDVHTKLICTIGPSSSSVEILCTLIRAGMTGARFSLLCGDYESYKGVVNNLKTAIKKTGKMCAVILDTRGPAARVELPDEATVELESGQDFELMANGCSSPGVPHAQALALHDFEIIKDVKVGDRIFLGSCMAVDDSDASGYVKVIHVNTSSISCQPCGHVRLEGHVKCALEKQGPDDRLDQEWEALAEWDQPGLVDFLSLGCTQSAMDIQQMRAMLKRSHHMKDVRIIAKVETKEALSNFREILEEADIIQLSRGELGLVLPAEKVVPVQKLILRLCNAAAKPVVVNRVLDSMAKSPAPTRAEASDVANAVLDGADAILLGAETCWGQYPSETAATALTIAKEAELAFDNEAYFLFIQKQTDGDSGGGLIPRGRAELANIAATTVRTAATVNAALIVAFTKTGSTPRYLAAFRPRVPILAVFLPTLRVAEGTTWHVSGALEARQSLLLCGVIPVLADPTTLDPARSTLSEATRHAKLLGLVSRGDWMVVVQKMGNYRSIAITHVE